MTLREIAQQFVADGAHPDRAGIITVDGLNAVAAAEVSDQALAIQVLGAVTGWQNSADSIQDLRDKVAAFL